MNIHALAVLMEAREAASSMKYSLFDPWWFLRDVAWRQEVVRALGDQKGIEDYLDFWSWHGTLYDLYLELRDGRS